MSVSETDVGETSKDYVIKERRTGQLVPSTHLYHDSKSEGILDPSRLHFSVLKLPTEWDSEGVDLYAIEFYTGKLFRVRPHRVTTN